MFNPLDPYNVGGIWAEVNKLNQQVCEPDKWLKEHIFNPDWGIWRRIDRLELHSGEQSRHVNEQIFNPDWGIWSRIGKLEKENAELKEEVRKLKELAAQLSQLENMLINAVNQQLGNK